MDDYNRLRQLFFCVFGFYLAMSVAQLHAKQPFFRAPTGMTMAGIVESLEWHMMEIGRTEQNQELMFWPGN